VEFDEELLLEGIAFKKWYFHACFSHAFIDKDGRANWPGLDKTITLLKRLGAWITYYGAFSAETEKPRSIDALPGASPDHQTLVWFGGGLKHLRKPWLLSANVENVHTLATMSGFGRALPPASAAITKQAAEDTFRVLTTKTETDPYWLDLFRIAADRVCQRMTPLPVVTHCSINATACLERTVEDGGMAKEVTKGVNDLLRTDFGPLLEQLACPPYCGYDPFGRRVFDRAITWTIWHRRKYAYKGNPFKEFPPDFRLPALGPQRPLIFGFFAYRGAFLDPRVNNGVAWNLPHANPHGGYPYNREIIDLLREDLAPFYNETLGDIVALWAFSEMLTFGHYEDLDGNRVEPLWPHLAIFESPGTKVWVQDHPVQAGFMALSEPGWKARCLTKNLSFVVILQSLLRHPVAEAIGSDGRVGLGLKSSYILWDFLKIVKKKTFNRKWYMISTDLKSATDLIPHDLLRAIWGAALPRLGLKKSHPLFALKNMVMLDHTLTQGVPGSAGFKEAAHLCGSFMGEPISFMGLSLYNLCVSEIAAMHCLYNLRTSIKYDLTSFSSMGPTPSGYICIVGDDRFEFTDLRGMFPLVNDIYRLTNGSPSPEKNTVSSVHGMLAENHVFFDGGTPLYLDIIKAKLLTPSTRFHFDNQSSILGKGSQLYQQLEWTQETMPCKGRTAAIRNARMIYTNMVLNGFFPKDMKLALELPISFPGSLGGINFPVKFIDSCRYFRKELDLLWWLVTESPLETFFEYAVGIKDVTSGKRRGLKQDPLSKLWKENISTLVKDQGLSHSETFDPTVKQGLYTLESVLKYVSANHADIPVSSVTLKPQVGLSVDLVYNEYGYLPIESLIDLWERQSTFTKAFLEGVKKQEKLSFHKYVVNLKKFWDKSRVDLSHVSFAGHGFKSMHDVHWKFQQRLRTFIHRDMCGGGRLASAATLFVRLRRVDGVQHTEQGWSDISDRAVHAYVQRIKSEHEEIPQ